MEHVIARVAERSPAHRQGIRAGDTLLAINGEDIADQIDYQALSSMRHVVLSVRKADGRLWQVEIVKPEGRALGLSFGESMALKARVCRNKCVFCFIDQMPRGARKSLYVKDDDWRMSLLMGNYVTLTNVDDAEFDRILRRRASPLYISVHACSPDVRVRMMGNPAAARLMPRLRALKDAGLRFHCQIVLCPGVNDGDVLRDTLRQLDELRPAAISAALVPVGLTRHREGLARLTPFDAQSANAVMDVCEAWQRDSLARTGARFVFPADELLCAAGRDVPPGDAYEGYPQIENGVGLMRRFLEGWIAAADGRSARRRRIVIPCGTSIAPYMRRWLKQYAPPGADARVLAVKNDYFGHTVTVTGLLTGGDLLRELTGIDADEILLCGDMLRAQGDLFLDDMPLSDLRGALKARVTVAPNDGAAFYEALLGTIPDAAPEKETV